MSINVLYCSHTADLKGSSISLYQLMAGLDRKEFRPVAAFSKEGPLVGRARSEGIHAYVLKERGFLGAGLIRETLGLIRKENIGLVHLNSAVPFCKYAGIAAKMKVLPVVWHVREDPQGKRVRDLMKWIRLLAGRIIVVSSDQEEVFRDSGKAVKIYNGVDTDIFRPGLDGGPFRRQAGVPDGAFVFGMVGSVERRKGCLEFLKAAEALADERPDVYFAIVGTGRPEDVSEVRDFMQGSHALKGKAVMTGSLHDMPGVMAGIDVLVMPSFWEGFPRALIEAMASGRPGIASSVGEVPNIIEDGKTGLVVPKGDVEALRDAMKKCLGMPDTLKEMGMRARLKAVTDFTLKGHVNRVVSEYRKIL